MNMRRPKRMSIHQLQQLPRRPIIRNRIRRRPQTIKVISPLVIRPKLAPQVKFHLVGILLLVKPIRRSLPHFDCGAGERLLRREVDHAAVHEYHFAVGGLGDDYVGAVLAVGRIGAEEWAEDCGCGGCIFGFVGEGEGYFVDEAGIY